MPKIQFLTFQAKPARVRVISSICIYKCSFREISMIIMVILDQNKPVWLKFENPKILNSKI